MVVKRTTEEVDALRNEVAQSIDDCVRRFPAMTYEEGIRAAIDWLLGDSDDHPYEKD